MTAELKAPLLTRMAQVVGHEIRNPLAVINNSVYFLKVKLGAGVDAKVTKHLGILESEVKRADALIEDIQIAFRRSFQPIKKPTPWADMLPEGMKLTKKISGESPSVDAKIMADVLRRLLQNAEEAGAATITVMGDARGLTIKDTGPGFAPEVLALAFDPFVTTKAKNLGLGLYICKKAVEAHGGKLTVEKPSTVKITL